MSVKKIINHFYFLKFFLTWIFVLVGAGFLIYKIVQPAYAASLQIIGKALSSNTGAYLNFTDNNANVRVNWVNGIFSGYAFSDDLGWVAFGTDDNPQGPVSVNTSTGAISGKAKVMSTGAYIDFGAYNSNVIVNTETGILTGWVWSEDLGWLNFSEAGVSINNFSNDKTEPITNASNIGMSSAVSGGYSIGNTAWSNIVHPYFAWSAGADNDGGSGLKGYCLYLGTDISADPGNSTTYLGSSGLLVNSPTSTVGTDCLFIVSTNHLDLATGNYLSRNFITGETYYLKIKAIDNAGNTYNTSTANFSFKYDNTIPTNVNYLSCASGSFSNASDMSFNWPTSGSVQAADAQSGLLGWQYQINSTTGPWFGTVSGVGLSYIPIGTSTRQLTTAQDGNFIQNGNNVVYFRTVDIAGNVSNDATIRTCNLSFGGQAPSFENNVQVAISPSTSTVNSFALSWPSASATVGKNVSHYYYMVNTPPPSTLSTLQSNASTYIDVGTSLSLSATSLTGVNKGTNTVYIVAIDDSDNYSPSNFISGTFTLNSTDPDNVGNLVASDSSIKSQSQWNVTLTWTEPVYQGAGNLTYLVYRSTDGISFSLAGSTQGLSYVDNAPSSRLYYYKIYSKDGADAQSSGTNSVSITPTGKWTSAPSLDSGPNVGSITTKKATITWGTSRSSDSKIAYGAESGRYSSDEVSNSSQVSSHSVNLTNLKAGTLYYYQAKWTDEDGNTGSSEEKTFTTQSAPTIKNVSVKNISLSTAIIQFTSNNASKVKIYYGPTTSFGGFKETYTSTTETTYTAELSGLQDGTKYYFKINSFDSENAEYDGTTLDFSTLPRPKISNVKLEQVANTAQSTIRVTWNTNTEISSIISFYPENNPSDIQDEIKIALEKGSHSLILRGLLPETKYILLVKGRDKIGNEAISDSQRFTTATDTRPPSILKLKVISGTVPPVGYTAGEIKAQLIVSWDTDEPSTGQVEFGQGTGSNYPQKSPEDGNLTTNHTIILSNLTPSEVYHLRVISKDKAGNISKSIDTVTIASKATKSALDLVIENLSSIFGNINSIKLP